MKKIQCALLALLLVVSCKKNQSNIANGCISQLTTLPKLAASDNDSVLALLQKHNISPKNLDFYDYESSYVQNQQIFYQLANAIQVQNGLPLFYSDVFYSFENGTKYIFGGIRYNTISLDTKSTLTLPVLRQLYLNEAVNIQGYNASLRDSCLVAQFGYFNLNMNNAADTTGNFVKAWQVRPAHSFIPAGYFEDSSEEMLFFDAGAKALGASFGVLPKRRFSASK